MKKKAVLRVLAMLLVFIMATSNVLASAMPMNDTGSAVAEDGGGEVTQKTITVNGTEYTGAVTVQAVTGSSVKTLPVSGYTQLSNAVRIISTKQIPAGITITAGSDGSSIIVTIDEEKVTEETTFSLGVDDVLVNVTGESGTTWGATLEVKVTSGPEVSPSEPEVSPSEPEVSPSEPEVSPSEPEVSPSEPEVSPSDTETKPTDTEVSPSVVEEINGAIDSITSELPTVEKEDPSVAAIIDKKVDDMIEQVGEEKLANALTADTSVRDNYKALDEIAQTAKGVKEVKKNNTASSIKGTIEVSGLALGDIDDKNNVGLTVATATGSARENLNSSEAKEVLNLDSNMEVKRSVQLVIDVTGVKKTDGKLGAPVVITMPVPTNFGRNIVILHYTTAKTKPVKITPKVSGGKMTFAVSHFSTFAVVEVGEKPVRRPSSGSSGGFTSSSSTVINNVANTTAVVKTAAGLRIRLANGTYVANQWQKINNKWYFADETSYMALGWKMINNKWYYLDPTEGAMVEDWIMIDGKYYYLNPTDGDMAEGWKMVNGKWYYLNPVSGDMATGWKVVDGKWYYLDPVNGDCFMNTTTPDGYRVDENGAWIQ